jgi:hypothetical protein
MAERGRVNLRGALIGLARRLARGALGLLRRGYALALMALILWLSWSAVRYLVLSLTAPSQTPAQIAGIPKRLDEQLLHGARPDWAGLAAVENPRSPPSHYHRFDTWIEPDAFNDCTRAGCHGPLPHSRRKESRAFLNLHSTSMHCGVCHLSGDERPRPLVWYSLRNGRPRGRPSLLDAYDWLERRDVLNPSTQVGPSGQHEIARLLRAAAKEGQGEPHLGRLARDITAERAGSPAMLDLLATAREAVRRASRGSYGAKLALRDASGRPVLAHANTEAAVRDWLALGATAGGEQRERLLAAVHPGRRTAALECMACHRVQGSLIDFAAVGYPPGRVRDLTEAHVFDMIQHILDGRPFRLPAVGVPPPLDGSQP